MDPNLSLTLKESGIQFWQWNVSLTPQQAWLQYWLSSNDETTDILSRNTMTFSYTSPIQVQTTTSSALFLRYYMILPQAQKHLN